MAIFLSVELVFVCILIAVVFTLLWLAIRREQKRNKLVGDISFSIASSLNLEELGTNIFKVLNETMKTERGFIAAIEKGEVIWSKGFQIETSTTLASALHEMILQLLENRKEIVFVTRHCKHTNLKKILQQQGIELVIPLVVHQELTGILLVGEKATRKQYTHLETDVFTEIEPVTTVTLKNALAYKKLADISGTIDMQVKTAHDIAQAAQQKVMAMDASKDEFISIASHELRTPITAIKGYLWICLNQAKKPLEEDVKKNIETCYHSAERLLRMVSDMLTVSRMDKNNIALNIQKLDIAALLNRLHEEMSVIAKPREITFSLKLAKPSLMIEGDRERLQELFHNIIDNALKFAPHRGTVTIDLHQNGDRDISVLIFDNGPGIPKENKDNLFTKFGKIQYAYDKTHAVEGAGLGLYISKKIVDLHSGIISVESEVGKGTTFIITLPYRVPKK